MAALRKTHGAGSGRPPKPATCRKCGAPCASMRAARAHCVGRPRRDLPYGRRQSTDGYPAQPPRPQARVHGTLLLGSLEKSGETEEWVPVYLEAVGDLVRVRVEFAIRGQSPLHFVPTAATPPTLVQKSQPAGVTVAWLEGISLQPGERLLLGYVAGIAGATANLEVHSISAFQLG
jgi:hypothetical protein